MKQKRNVLVAVVLSVATGFLSLHATRVSAPAPDAITQTPEMETAATEMSITEPSVTEPCAYVWAYHDAPDLTQKINTAVQAIDPSASANANLFGEDCVYADGRSTFGVMETDFYVHLPTDDLTNDEALGNWMARVLPIIAKIPRGEIRGNYGFAEFWFEKNETEQVITRVLIQKYLAEAQGKTGAELFRMFYSSQ